MLEKKEIGAILGVIVVLGFVISITQEFKIILYTFSSIFFVIIINICAKKIAGFYLDSEIEIKLWEIKRYGFKPSKYFRKPFPAGLIFPLIAIIFSLGNFIWLASLTFEVKPKVYKAAKRFGLYTFSEITESQIGLIASAGISMNLIFAIFGYLIGFSNFAALNIYYAFFNMIPLWDLDGNKIFFGNLVTWSFLTSIVLVALGYVFFII